MKLLHIATAVIFTILLMSSCEKNCNCPYESNSQEFTAAYQCKNHCQGSGSETKAKCPCCGSMQNDADEFTHCCPNHEEMRGFKNQKCKKV